MPKGPYKDIPCGSYAGYQRHYRAKEPACDSCKAGAAKYTRAFYQKNKDKIKKRPAFKEARRRNRIKRRVRERGNRTEPYTLNDVLETYGTVCYLCSKEIDMNAPRNCSGDNWEMGLHIDHVIDLQYGGEDSLENVRPAHAKCNLSKSKIRPPSRKG